MLTTLLISTLFQAYNILKILEAVAMVITYWLRPSRQILVPRTSLGRPPPTSLGRPLKILFDGPRDVLIWRPGDGLKWRPGDFLIRLSRDVPGRLIRDVSRTFSGRLLEDLESTRTWISKLFFQNLFVWPNLKAFQHSRGIENQVKLLRWSIFFKIS